jgi:hypothetical protein
LVSIGLLLSEEKIFEKVYDVSGELKNTEVFFVHPSDPKIYIAIFVWTSTIKDYKIGICCFSDKHTA